ncbi:bifunctional 5,10-methylenetetrahydrofolate dehydrogenase/5,10-methenyltetrahydrofolate cyclohydrolase [Patescibacteria group bacterium]|nr:bifunctional 5,10-methylenetetrahydrofolate dehydrogenase/5,10-methenyltetrahydrofolate cyclohydrolase [Patescibacteria group bacterium]
MDIDGKKLAKEVLHGVERDVEALQAEGISITLAVVLVGDNEASLNFVNKKKKQASNVGINFELFHFKEDISEKKLLQSVQEIQDNPSITGLIVQLPLPKHIDKRGILDMVDPCKDVDCLTSINLGKLMTGTSRIKPPTAAAIEYALDQENVLVEGKDIVIVGRGELVGKPLSIILTARSATVTVCHSKTVDLASFTRKADILVSGVGRPNLISGDMVKDNAVIIDTGASFTKGVIVGDVCYEEVSKKARLVSPVPGGIGPITVSKLLENCVILARACGQ